MNDKKWYDVELPSSIPPMEWSLEFSFRACVDAYEETGYSDLLFAARVMQLLAKVDLDAVNKDKPFPWRFDETEIDSPILASGNSHITGADTIRVLRRDGGIYPPSMETCKAIAEVMNMVRVLQGNDATGVVKGGDLDKLEQQHTAENTSKETK